MKTAGGAVALALTTLLVCCGAAPHQELELNEHSPLDHSDSRYEDSKVRNLEPFSGGHLLRTVREAPYFPYGYGRQYDSWSRPYESQPTYGRQYLVRSDEPAFSFRDDRSPLSAGGFNAKRNFDEIDHTNMPFPYAAKRFVRYYGPSYLGSADFDRKRNRADFPMDEIDLSQFPIGSKRSSNEYPLLRHALR